MKSNKNTRAVAVGVFIFVALLIFIVGVLTLGGQRKTFAKTIDAKALFTDVSGLQTGSNIWYAGVKVGTVGDIALTPAGHVEVGLSIDENAQQYIRKNAKAKIGSDGLIGNKIIVLYGGTAGAGAVNDGDVLAVENALTMDDMMSTLQANNKNLLDITNNFKTVSEGLAGGKGTVGRLLNDETMALQLEATLATLKKATGQATTITENIANYTAKLQRKGSLTNDLVTDTIVFSRLRSSVAQIESLSRTAGDVVSSLKSTSQNLNADLGSTTSPVGVLLHDTASAESLRAVIKNLQTSTQKLDENMEALQHNFLLRGFFKKKRNKDL